MKKSPALSKIRVQHQLLACGAVTLGLWGTEARATTELDLTSTAAVPNLATAGSYSQNTAPAAGFDLAFGQNSTTYNAGAAQVTLNTGGALTVGSLNDLDTTQTLVVADNGASGALSFNAANGVTTGPGTGTDSVSGAAVADFIFLAANTNLRIQSGSGTLTLGLPNTNTAGAGGFATFDVGSGATLTVNSAIVNTGGNVMLTGAGTVTFAGANTFGGTSRGVTTSATGTFNINNASAIGDSRNALTITAGSTIDNTSGAAITTAGSNPTLGTNAVVVNGSFTFTGTNNLTFGVVGSTYNTAPVTLNTTTASQTITTTGGTLTLNGIVSGSNKPLTKAGAGTLVLGGANTYSGGTTISAGILTVANTTGSGTGTGAVALGATTGTTVATLASGAGTSGIITGNVTAGSQATATVSPGGAGVVGLLTLTTLTAANGATFAYDLGATSGGPSTDHITLTTLNATGTAAGGLAFNFTGAGTAGTTYDLVDYTTGTALTVSQLSATGANGTFALDPNATTGGMEIDFTVTPVPEPSTWIAGVLATGLVAWNLRKRLAGASISQRC